MNTLSVFERISVDGRPKRIEMYAFSNENALVWTGSYSISFHVFIFDKTMKFSNELYKSVTALIVIFVDGKIEKENVELHIQ